MAELDTIKFINPTSEDFTHNYNGEPYSIKAGEEKHLSKFVAFHLAKHLSSQMIVNEAKAGVTKKEIAELYEKGKTHSALALRISQLQVYDTPERRIALYKIFGNESLVQAVINAYPFKGLVGDMKIYESFVQGLKVGKESEE